MPVQISRSLLTRLKAAAAGSADEICGLLLGEGERIDAVLHCDNVASDPRTRFEIDPRALIAAHRAARSGGPGIVGVYHSHPGGRADPSPRDADDAAADGWLWIIVGAGEVRCWRAVAGGAVHGRFDAVAFEADATIR